MRQLLVLVAIALLLIGVALVSVFGPEAPPAPDSGEEPADRQIAVRSDSARRDVGGSAESAPALARDEVDAVPQRNPLPDEAEWVELRVVDKATGQPVVGAEVRWFDRSIWGKYDWSELSGDVRNAVGVDAEQQAKHFGWSTLSDEHGIARVHRADGTQVTARHGSLYGHREIEPSMIPPPDGFVIELERDAGIDVQVLDVDGRPAGGVSVGLGVFDAVGAFVGFADGSLHATTRARDGVAHIAHTAGLPEPSTAGGEFRVFLNLAGHVGQGVVVDPDDPPSAPIVLKLPATGTLEVRLSVAGKPRVPSTIWVSPIEPSAHGGGHQMRSPDRDGCARFVHVPIGQAFSVSARFAGSFIGQHVAGPVVAGETVVATIEPPVDAILLTGRLLGPGSEPIANHPFVIGFAASFGNKSDCRTDGDGRFVTVLRESVVRLLAQGQHVRNRATVSLTLDGVPLSGTAEFRGIRLGVNDLGNLPMSPPPVLVAGRCFVDGKPGKVERLEVDAIDANGQSSWESGVDSRVAMRDDGTFTVYGHVDRERLVVKARGSYLPSEPVVCRPGTTGVVLSVRKAGTLTATVLLPDTTADMFEAWLVRRDATDPEAEPNGRAGDLDHRGQRRRQYSWDHLAAGTYELRLGLAGFDEVLHVVDNVRVPLSAGGDPRLREIDLRALVRVQKLRLLGPSNRSADVFPAARVHHEDVRAIEIEGPEARMLLPHGDTEVFVCASGCRPVRVFCNGEPVDVRPTAWPQARIQIEHDGSLPDGAVLWARLARATDRPLVDGREVGRRLWRHFVVSPRQVRVDDGFCELAIDDRPRRLQLQLAHQRRRISVAWQSRPISIAKPCSSVRVDSAALRRAIGKIVQSPR